MSSNAPTASVGGAAEKFLRRNIELVIAILLGIVSIFIAYASFQGSLYDGNQAQAYTNGSNLATEAESLYLEGNQQYVQDAQLYDRLTDLQLDTQSADPTLSAAAAAKYDVIYFQSVSESFDLAIKWADAQNAADPELYYSPLDNEDYQAELFGSYAETSDLAQATIADGDLANTFGDRLTLTTVLMAISLFLLGIAAVVRGFRTQIVLGVVAVTIFLLAGGIALTVPALPLWT